MINTDNIVTKFRVCFTDIEAEKERAEGLADEGNFL